MSLLALAGTNSATGGYEIDNSLKLEADNTEYLNRTPTANGSRTTWTTSVWVKRTEIGVDQAIFSAVNSAAQANFIRFRNTDQLRFYFQPDNTAITYYADTNAVFRDTSAWYHIVWGLDSTNSDGSKRFVVYVNGVYQESTWAGSSTASTNCAQNSGSLFLQSQPIQIGKGTYGADHYFNGYMADLHVLDGIAPDPTDFGEYDEDSGIWKPIEYTGSHGTQGFYLDFESSGSLGADSSGNGNNFSLNNITAADQATDTPTNNFCIMSPLWNYATSSTLTNGGTYVSTTTAGWTGAKGSIGIQNGKWYWEVKSTNVGWSLFPAGIQTDGEDNISSGNAHSQNTTMALGTGSTYIKYVSGVESSVSTGGAAMSNNNITGVALDLDSATKTLKWYKNNSLIGTVNIETVSASFGNQPVFPFSSIYADTGTVFIEYNFGGYTTFSISSPASDANGYGTFEYAPPSGYYALCTKNLEEFG